MLLRIGCWLPNRKALNVLFTMICWFVPIGYHLDQQSGPPVKMLISRFPVKSDSLHVVNAVAFDSEIGCRHGLAYPKATDVAFNKIYPHSISPSIIYRLRIGHVIGPAGHELWDSRFSVRSVILWI